MRMVLRMCAEAFTKVCDVLPKHFMGLAYLHTWSGFRSQFRHCIPYLLIIPYNVRHCKTMSNSVEQPFPHFTPSLYCREARLHRDQAQECGRFFPSICWISHAYPLHLTNMEVEKNGRLKSTFLLETGAFSFVGGRA